MKDGEFVASFEDCSLFNGSFHHADHVRMAFLYFCRYPAPEAMERFSNSLLRFATAKGKPELYDDTLTRAYLLSIHERMVRAGCRETWSEFAAANSDLLTWTHSRAPAELH